MNLLDNYLIVNLQQGDENAKAEIYRYFYPIVFANAKKILGNDDDAEEITSATFALFYAQCQNFEYIGAISKYLLDTVKYESKKLIRLRKRTINTGNEFPDLETDDQDIFKRLMRTDIINTIIKKSSRLRPKYRDVITLMLKGDTTEEIANKLNISQENVRKRKQRALEKMFGKKMSH